jgi:hypothetical protein
MEESVPERQVDGPVLMRRARVTPEAMSEGEARTRGARIVRAQVLPDVLDIWVSQRLDERWVAAFRLVQGGGRVRVGEARIFPLEPGYCRDGEWSGCWLGADAEAPRRGLTKELLLKAQPHLWLSFAERRLPGFSRGFGLQPSRPAKAPGGRGRPAHSDAFLAEVAAEYVRAVRGGRRDPVAAVARGRGKKVGRVSGWVHQARLRGLLTLGAQGKVGGRLTGRASHILVRRKK